MSVPVGVTRRRIGHAPVGWHLVERTIRLQPEGVAAARAYLCTWDLKRRAGFRVPSGPPVAGARTEIVARVWPVSVHEPVVVLWNGDGFGYRTRPGHPLEGEESFVLDAAQATFTVRSLSRPATPVWRALWPALRIVQTVVVGRYLAAVRAASTAGSADSQARGK